MVNSILHRLQTQANNRPEEPAYYKKVDGQWVSTNWRTYYAQVRAATKSLLALGFAPGEVVTILGFNTPDWVVFDLAGMMAGGAAAGIYATNSPQEVQYIVDHCDSPYLLLEDEKQWAKVEQELERLPSLRKVIMMSGAPAIDHELVMSWDDFVKVGADVPDADVDERLGNLTEDGLATLIYTSGTTGPPKGVMLSHENLFWTSLVATQLFGIGPEDSSLSYLPLSHIAEQMFTIHGPINVGWQVYFAESPTTVADNLKEVTPSIVFGVPRVWERFYNGVSARLGEATGVKAKLIAWARSVGRQMTHLRNAGREPSAILNMQYNLADRLVFANLRQALGLSNMKVCASGAAPISKEILEFFGSLGIIIYEIYGQSEDSGPTTINYPGNARFGSVGKVIPGMDVKIAEDGEILAKGPNVFLGYFKNEDATESTLQDEYLYSGDIGQFDEDGYLWITGRKKEIIITSGGKNIAPANIEAALKDMELVNDAIIIGDQRKFLSALVTLEPDALARFAAARDLPQEDLHENEQVVAAVGAMVEEVNKKFARVENIRRFRLLPAPFSVEGGELTPTLKLKRRIVYKKYWDTIEGIYEDVD